MRRCYEDELGGYIDSVGTMGRSWYWEIRMEGGVDMLAGAKDNDKS